MKRIILCPLLLLFSVSMPLGTSAQQPTQDQKPELSANELKNANNPLAPKTMINIHNYFVPSLHGLPDVTLNNLNIRVSQPVGRFFLRASLPVNTISAAGASPRSDIGDLSIFGIYTFPNISPGVIFGVGPVVTLPTGGGEFGLDKWQAGLSAVVFLAKSPVLQFGTLLQWQMSFADAGHRGAPDVNTLTPQIFAMWQLGAGTYLRSTGTWSVNLGDGNYNIPLGLGIGKVVKAGGTIFNLFIEPQYSMLAHGIGQPKLQIFAGINTQF